jgi:hypothetical protein
MSARIGIPNTFIESTKTRMYLILYSTSEWPSFLWDCGIMHCSSKLMSHVRKGVKERPLILDVRPTAGPVTPRRWAGARPHRPVAPQAARLPQPGGWFLVSSHAWWRPSSTRHTEAACTKGPNPWTPQVRRGWERIEWRYHATICVLVLNLW